MDGHVKPKAEFKRAEKRKEAKLRHTEDKETMEKLDENS